MNISDYITSTKQQTPAFQYAPDAPAHNLQLLAVHFENRLVFQTNFSLEDQIITHLIAAHKLPVRIFTRANNSQQIRLKETVEKLGVAIEVLHQQSIASSRELASRNPVYASQWAAHPASAPLPYLLDTQHLLIGSQRGQQNSAGATKQGTPLQVTADGLQTRFYPLFHWSTEQIYDYVRKHHVPVNLLPFHDFVQIYATKPPRLVRQGVRFSTPSDLQASFQPVRLS